jgi:hypothetical protein
VVVSRTSDFDEPIADCEFPVGMILMHARQPNTTAFDACLKKIRYKKISEVIDEHEISVISINKLNFVKR